MTVIDAIIYVIQNAATKILILSFVSVVLNIFILIFVSLKFKQVMNKQERLDAANEKTFQAVVGIGKDFQTFVKEVKDGTVSEESIQKAEQNADALAALDASKEDTSNEPASQPAPGNDAPNEAV